VAEFYDALETRDPDARERDRARKAAARAEAQTDRPETWFGFVPRERIVGRATSVVISLDTKGSYLPRWDRFFSKLD